MLEQILMNLVAHARGAMPDGGGLRIETAAVDVGGGAPRPHARLIPAGFAPPLSGLLVVSTNSLGLADRLHSGMTDREDVTESELLAILNEELARRAGDADVRFTGYVALTAGGPEGCNWDPRPLRLTGEVGPERYYRLASEVLEEATQRYRVKR